MNVSLYVHGLISFGAITGGMITTSGDETFVMLIQFPGTANIRRVKGYSLYENGSYAALRLQSSSFARF
ncbi:MAG: hypothetical protein HN737_12920 [Desulfobacterales bacterium]|jgi:hypothetical protein|nr:hypothetical protein [Desulfobacteraceae bacterium]MBT7085157.1 hypothetical protein [Desulfobacterales bacterium]MBT7698298.1 hypothetical protein [Desulfobacterales bacterium]